MIVVDASVALKWVLPEAGAEAAHSLMREESLVAPDFLLLEAANVLWTFVRRNLRTIEETDDAYAFIARAPVAFTPAADLVDGARRLAQLLNITVYDATYVALAQRLRAGLATADSRLAKAALESGIIDDVRLIG